MIKVEEHQAGRVDLWALMSGSCSGSSVNGLARVSVD